MNAPCSTPEGKDLQSRGTLITIKKISFKPGKTSKTKIGSSRTGVLAKTMAIGHPICFKNQNYKNSYFPATTQIVSIEEDLVTKKLIVETDTSIYQAL